MWSHGQSKNLLLLSATEAAKRCRNFHYIGSFLSKPSLSTNKNPRSPRNVQYESTRSYSVNSRVNPELQRNLKAEIPGYYLDSVKGGGKEGDDVIIAHVQRTILECLRDENIKNQICALSALHSFSRLSTRINDVLLRNGVLSSLLELLEKPYQKSIWTLVNSYIWPKNPVQTEDDLAVQEKVLCVLTSMALNSKDSLEMMEKDLFLKKTLLKIYFYYSSKAADAKDGTNTSESLKPGVENSCVFNDSNENNSRDIRALIKDLFRALGYEMNEDILSLPSNLIGDNNETKDWTWDSIVPFSSTDGDSKIHIEDLIKPINANLKRRKSSKETDKHVSSSPILWVPYYSRNIGNSVTASIKRYIRINIGCTDEQLFDFQNISTLTISPQSESNSNEDNLGVLALHRMESDVTRYSLISNIRLRPSKHFNRDLIILDLLSSMGNLRDFKTLNDIFTELWILLGSKSAEVIDVIHNNLNLKTIINIANATTLKIPLVSKNTADFSMPEGSTHSIVEKYLPWSVSKLETFRGYLKSFINNMETRGIMLQLSNFLSRAARKFSTICFNSGSVSFASDQETVIPTNNRNDYNSPGNTAEQAKKLQTTLFGFLVELLYLGGDKSFVKLRDSEKLIDAIKSAKLQYPKILKSQEITAENLSEYKPIIDRSTNSRMFTTNIIGDLSPNAMNYSTIVESYGGTELDLNDLDEFRSNSWKRHSFCGRDDIGPIYNSNKLLNLLGHHDLSKFKNRGVRILSIDGGGSKGVIALEILRKIFMEMGKPIHEIFDLICGTSTGGIVAALLALEKVEIQNIQKLYDLLISRIFVKDSYHVSGARLIMRHALYDESVFVGLLKTLIGEFELIDYSVDETCPKFFCLSTQLDTSPLKPVIWRNYNYPPESYECNETKQSLKGGSCIIKLADALRATTAAPGYFPAFERNGHIYGDGALYSNNPSLIAYMEAKVIYPNIPIDCIVSVGNGNVSDCAKNKRNWSKTSNSMSENMPSDLPQSQIQSLKEVFGSFMDHGIVKNCGLVDINSGTSKQLGIEQIISQVISAATNTEMVHSALDNFMEPNKYYRFNPVIPSVRIDETNREVLDYLKNLARDYLQEKGVKEKIKTLKPILML